MPKDLRILPKLRDSLSFLYVEHAIVEQDHLAIVRIQGSERTPIPIAAITTLMLGPGVSITHAAIKVIADSGCSVIWCGEHSAKYYATGMGETRSAANLILQSKLHADVDLHMKVVRRMYQRRFSDLQCEGLTLQQIRGLEGIRMRETYRRASKQYNVKWNKRNYDDNNWDQTDDINKALSMANSVLYAICQSAIVSLGFSTGLGFIHTGKMLSFVYDIADLYKADTSIPAAFSVAGGSYYDLGKQVRIACRKAFHESELLKRIPKDIEWIFDMRSYAEAQVAPTTGDLWNGENDSIAGGINHGSEV